MAGLSLPGSPGGIHGLPALILITDHARLPDPERQVRRLPRGSAVIVRDYDAPDRAALARRLAGICRARRLKLVIAGDARLAQAVRADGLHLPQALVTAVGHAWRRWRRPGFLVTAAAHDPRALAAAARCGVDAVLLSPVFATASHPGAPGLGVVRFARLVRLSRLPVYALGGITASTAGRLAGSGIAGLAGISGIVGITGIVGCGAVRRGRRSRPCSARACRFRRAAAQIPARPG